jgi:type II secretory ATPase GspE/PulE/Tfp pilus assembly ATPase PilB-like protein
LETGYRGRVPVIEWVRVDEAARRQIREHGAVTVLPEHSLEAAAQELVEQGITSEAEYARILSR